jgi:hypothetical protein
LAKTLDDPDHAFAVEHSGDVMGDGRNDLPAADVGKVGEKGRADLPANIGKGAAVEEKERGAAMAMPQKIYEFGEGEGFSLLAAPFCCNRCLSLSIKAVLRSTSFARSSIEADDKLPTPVFEKLGSGL